MPNTECMHDAALQVRYACPHLLPLHDADYYKRFSGEGNEYALLCAACNAKPLGTTLDLQAICTACFKQIEETGWWDGISGQPQIFDKQTNLRFAHQIVNVEMPQDSPILAVEPLNSSHNSHWIMLNKSGRLFQVDFAQHTVTELMQLSQATLDYMSPISLHLSRRGDYIAIVNTHGQNGLVLSLRTVSVTMHLKRDDYQTRHSSFPIAFYEDANGNTLLVHGTAWNRLDIADPATGRLLTDRSFTPNSGSETRPEHFLNYFHSALLISPDQQWVVDNGWVWSPFGVVTSWSMNRWFNDNVWESESGSSRRALCQRAYYWDGPYCWIGNKTIAIGGYGLDDEWLIPAAWLFDVETGEEQRWFAGPKGTFIFDTYLFSSFEQLGMSVWDPVTGERLLHELGFHPTCYHHGTKQFLTLLPNGEAKLSQLQERAV